MITDASPQALVYFLVISHAKKTGLSQVEIWDRLYARFEYEHNLAVRRLAYNNNQSGLDVVVALGKAGELLEVAREMFGNPASPEKEKAPVQGSLLEGEQ